MNKEAADKARSAFLKELGPDWMTPDEAARTCGITTAYVLVRVGRGQLECVRKGRYVFVKKTDILKLKETVVPRGHKGPAELDSVNGDKVISVTVPKKMASILALQTDSNGEPIDLSKRILDYLEIEYKKTLNQLKKNTSDFKV
jgi:hypothetical protein